MKLICFPFAGGNRYSYREYETRSAGQLKMVCLEYPGRGKRTTEPLQTDIEWLVEDACGRIRNEIQDERYAIYGHSMGALIAFLVSEKLIRRGQRPPTHLFITGTCGPSALSRKGLKRHLLGKKEFLTEILNFEGVPEEIGHHQELLDYYEPILRADFKATETYQYRERPPMDIPFTVITGSEEAMTQEDILLWQKESKRPVDFRQMNGKHFFILKHVNEIVDIILNKLNSHKNEPRYE